MTPRELHDLCHDACWECPQFRGYEDDMFIPSVGKDFGLIPDAGMMAVVNFWKEESILWESGYYKALPLEVQVIFEDLDRIIADAVNTYLKSL